MDKFLEELRRRGAILPAARAAGVGRSTVYDAFKAWPDFRKEVDDALEACVEDVEESLYENALDPDKTTDRIFFLKTRKPEVYGDKLRQDQIDEIKRDARKATLAEVEEEIARLPEEARKIVLAALTASRKELTNPPGGKP